ncbi:MAG: DNA polymerase I [Chloroflexi bacterium]|nr:DNA polymerase I [Chloroflexota bacterium]|tara:strand:- start:1141 stop:3897 length:2757 start_codon:yes stop_codon:yes gene_type:complete
METKSIKNKLLIIDGHAMIFRAWFSIPERLSSKGINTSIIFGFLSSLFKLISVHQPTHLIITLDPKGPTFRHELYPEYKANRDPAPPEFKKQIPLLEKVLKSMRIPIYSIEKYEADDLIGTITSVSSKDNFENIIVTGDKDLFQLINDNTHIWYSSPNPRSMDRNIDKITFSKEKDFEGLTPKSIPDYKGLAGDASDNIKGIPGIGKKAANTLLRKYQNLEDIYKNITHIENLNIRGAKRIQSLLIEYKEEAFKSRELATIFRKIPNFFNLTESKFGSFNREEVIKELTALELISLVNRIPSKNVENSKIFKIDLKNSLEYITVNTDKKIHSIINDIKSKGIFSFDTETSSIKPFDSNLVGISISIKPNSAWYLPINHEENNNISPENLKLVKEIFQDQTIEKIAHNSNFDMSVLINNGFEINKVTFDTMIAANLLGKRSISLSNLCLEEFNQEMTPIENLIGKGKDQISFSSVPIKDATLYSCADSDITLKLKNVFEKELEKNGLLDVMNNIEMPLVPVIVKMQKAGVSVNIEKLNILSKLLNEKINFLEQKTKTILGEEINLRSSQQLGKILIENLGVPPTKKTKTGYTMDANTLEEILNNKSIEKKARELIKIVLDHREFSKIKSTYADSIPELINKKTGRIHTYFNQAGTSTGRLSSTNPNLQNIPVRTKIGNEVRKAFESNNKNNHLLLSADYSQIELKILAHLSKEPSLLQAFRNNEDIHDATAKIMYETNSVSKEQRRIAKILNFGVIYGLSPHGVSRQTDLSREDGKKFIDLYFGKYPGIKNYIDQVIDFAKINKYVETITGRRRLLPEITSPNFHSRTASERMAINMPIQGSSADIIKIAMIKIDEEIKSLNLKSKMIIQVHDELIFEAPKNELNRLKEILTKIMPNSLNLSVPLTIDINIAKSWGELK